MELKYGKPKRPIVFFDGGCPLCRKEIKHYQQLDKRHRIEWVDISHYSERLNEFGISVSAAMKRFHCIDEKRNTLIGVAGFLMIWEQLKFYKYLALFVRITRLTSLLSWAYNKFAIWRFDRRCKDGCSLD